MPTARDAARTARREAALAARAGMTPPGPAVDRLRIASWNVNSLRARAPGMRRFVERVRPDVLALQETRSGTLAPEAAAAFDELGHTVVHVGRGSWNGVAITTPHPVLESAASGELGVEVLDREPRVATALIDAPDGPVRVVDVYVPHGREVGADHYEYKLAFLSALADLLREHSGGSVPLVLAGDVNVAATDHDVFHPDAFVGSTHVTEPERDALRRVLDVGLVDLDVVRWGGDARRFTWWNHGIGYARNLGMRLDLIAADTATAARLDTTWVDHTARSDERPSDHAPLIADLVLR